MSEKYPFCSKSISNDEYQKHPAISKTKLDLFARDARNIEWDSLCPEDEDKTKTLDFGDAMHAICLEPWRLKSEFVVMPELNLRTNVGKAEKAEFEEANQDKKILTAEEYKKLNLMFESVMAHPDSRKIIESVGIAEMSCFWEDEETGVICRCRPDKTFPDFEFVVDIKTTDKLSTFSYSVEDFRYFVQDPFYIDGLNANTFDIKEMRFLVIQKTIECGKYPVMVRKLPEELTEFGRMTYKQNLRDYAEFRASPAKQPKVKELEIHNRLYSKIIDDTVQGIF